MTSEAKLRGLQSARDREVSPESCPSKLGASVLVGGSGSTGSSLLRTIFNRHESIFSGEELNFFNKRQLFANWDTFKNRLLHRNPWTIPRTDGWFEYSGTALTHPDYGWTENEIRALISVNHSLLDFSVQFFERPLCASSKSIWMEKTPSNCYCFAEFLATFTAGKVIHTARDPYEAVGSLVRRGMSPYFASALWIYNTCAALSARRSTRYILVRYEDLTRTPAQTIEDICGFLGIEYKLALLKASLSDSSTHTHNQGWRFDRNQDISTPAPAFQAMDDRLQTQIRHYLSALRVSDIHARRLSMTETTCKEACRQLGYTFEESDKSDLWEMRARLSIIQNTLRRTIRNSPTKIGNSPIAII